MPDVSAVTLKPAVLFASTVVVIVVPRCNLSFYNSAVARRQTAPAFAYMSAASPYPEANVGVDCGIDIVIEYGDAAPRVGVPVYGFAPSITPHELLPAGMEPDGLLRIVTGNGITTSIDAVPGLQVPAKVEALLPFEIKVKQYL